MKRAGFVLGWIGVLAGAGCMTNTKFLAAMQPAGLRRPECRRPSGIPGAEGASR
jgi:hypothetical protein